MFVQKAAYERTIARYCDTHAAVELLRQHRPYLEAVPSLRRLNDSLILLPFPLVRLREPLNQAGLNGISVSAGETVCLPCELGVVMCEPDWKIKVGVEIFILVHRPQEDFSDLMLRWRQTQVLLDRGYEWVMPYRYRHIYSESAQRIFPLFVVFEETPARIKQGLDGASLPYVVEELEAAPTEAEEELFSAESSSL